MTTPARKPRVFSESDFVPEAKKPRVFSESDFASATPNPDRIDAGAPTDYPMVNSALSGAEALAVGAADLIPGALSTARGIWETEKELGSAALDGRMPHPVDAFRGGQRAVQDQRARTQEEHPYLSALPAVASLAVPGAGLSKIGPLAKLGTSTLGRLGANAAAHAIPAAAGSMLEGDAPADIAMNALRGGLVGPAAGSKSMLVRAGALAPSLANAAKMEASAVPEGAKNISRAQTLAQMVGSLRGTGRHAREADVDIQKRNFGDAREQAALSSGETARDASLRANARAKQIADAQAALASVENSAAQATHRFFDTKRSSVEDRMRAKERHPEAFTEESLRMLDAQDAMLARSLDSTTRQKLGDMRSPEEYQADWLAEHKPQLERNLAFAQRADEIKSAPPRPDYARADEAIAEGPKNIATNVRRGEGGRILPNKNGAPDIGGDYFIESSPFKASLTHPRRTASALARSALNFSRFGVRKAGNEAANEPRQSNRVGDFMATRKVKRPDGTTDTVFVYPAEAAAILKAYGPEIAPGRGAKASAEVQDNAIRGMVRSGITNNEEANKREKARQKALQKLRSRR